MMGEWMNHPMALIHCGVCWETADLPIAARIIMNAWIDGSDALVVSEN